LSPTAPPDVLPSHPTISVTHEDGVAVLRLDVPGRTMNVVDETVVDDLIAAMDAALLDPAVVGIVLTSGKEGSFGGGADLTTLPALAEDPESTVRYLEKVHRLMESMCQTPKPIVAALEGYALGGAFELVLGSSTIVATEDAVVGLPEATLGLIPAGGGTQLILRRVAPETAAELLVTGRTLTAPSALEVGLVDRVVPADDLIATAIATARTGEVPLLHHPGPDLARADAADAAGRAVRRVPSETARAAVLGLLRRGLSEGRAAGLAGERELFVPLLRGDESAALIHLFHAETAAKRRFRGLGTAPTAIAVVGGGQMGAGIAAAAVAHGLRAAVRDIDPARIGGARERAAAAGPQALARWTGTSAWEGFEPAQVVVEAVLELPDLKRETLALVDARVGPDTLITTNTSAIPVARLAAALSRPHQFLGTHFFSPVEKMPLVELVPHAGTDADSVARAGGLARALGKVAVVVADRPGFYTSRVYARWLVEGLRLLAEGADPALVESEARAVGFPVGPLQACDEVTLELVRDASVVQVAERVFPGRIDVPAVKELLERLIDAGIRGKRHGRGCYGYAAGRRSGIEPDLARVVASPGPGVAPGASGERLLLAFVTESLQCWDDATLCHPDDGDVAAVLGIGFPRALGGPFHWVDRQGAGEALARIERLASPAFPAGAALPRLAATSGRFADEPRRARPGP
jgi:3-hydroxyacyl-CoA dehydrogenase/enoyl-CoA hydratase/3-hydroxybutyryl-CoA epimerase